MRLIQLGGLTASFLLAARPVLAAEPDPVLGKPVFNNPAGAEEEQYTIFQQLAQIIDRVPAGEYIELSWFQFRTEYTTDTASKPNIPLRLANAHQRGVEVRVVLDNNEEDGSSNSDLYPYKTLAEELGTDDGAASYILLCQDTKGCIARRALGDVNAYNHNKFLIASAIELENATVSNVIFQSSGNLGEWDAHTAWNNAITWAEDKVSFDNYHKYFGDLRDHRDGPGDDDYYWVGDGEGVYKTHFFPRKETNGDPNQASTDTVVSVLDAVTCSYKGSDGKTHQTDVRVLMWIFTRRAVAEKLAALTRAGCWVDIAYAEMSDAVSSALKNTGGKKMGLTMCAVDWEGRNLRPHSKYMLIDGAYDDDQIPRVYTGSHNFALSALRNADEALIRIRSAEIHEAYLKENFYKVRDTCSGKTPL
jgi:hypothetical protein